MFRRSRFSVKPNVRPSAAGRSASASSAFREAPAPDAEAQPGSGSGSTAGEDSGDAQLQGKDRDRDENTSHDGDGSKCSETVLQRRKRAPTMPNLVKPRVAIPTKQRAISLISKCPKKPIPHPPASASTALQKESPEKVNTENSSKSPILPEKKTPVPQIPQFSQFKKSASKEPNACARGPKNDEASQKNMASPLKERPTQERLIQEEMTPSKSVLAKEKRVSLEREEVLKAQKLRKLLKEELEKEKQQRKYKYPVNEKCMPEDRSKMLMRDFIYYLPENNPMKSSLVEEKKTEKTSTVTRAKEPEQKAVAHLEDENEEVEEEGEEGDSPLLVPQVKVAEDGSIILDEESLTVEVLRTKAQCMVEDNDPIFERGSTTTYSSFRKSNYTKPWSEKETDMFFLAISMVGTDFSMISQLFPHRARSEIKNKFKREEKINGWRIDKAFKEKKPFDFDFFAKLLEKILENEKRRKEKDAKSHSSKEKIPKEKKAPKFQNKQKEVNGPPNNGQDVHMNGIMSDTEMEVDSETAEKENEESLSKLEQTEGQTATESGVTKKKRKRKKKDSELEADNVLEEITVSAGICGGERSRKKRKSTSSSIETSGIVTEDLKIADEEAPNLIEEESQCIIELNEDTKGDITLALLSIQPDAFIETESDGLEFLEARFEHCLGQPSESSPSTTKVAFEETISTKNDVAELNKLDENCVIPAPSHIDITVEPEEATNKTPTVKEKQQRFQPELTRVSEKKELQINETPEVKTSLSEYLGGTEKGTVENKVTKASGSTIEEMTERTNSDMEKESQESKKAVVEKVAVRGHRQKPKPNIAKVPGRKPASVEGKLEDRILCQGPDGKVGKSNDLNDAANSTSMKTAEEELFDIKAQKSLLQEGSKLTNPAPLARGQMQRPKPNSGRFARRKGTIRNTETKGETLTETVIEAGKTKMHCECSHDELIKDTAEATTYEADMTRSEILENKDDSSSKKVGSTHKNHPPAQEPLEYENCELKKTYLSSNSMEDVSNFAAGDSIQEEKREIAAETEHSLKSYPLNRKGRLRTMTETKTIENEHETEKGSVQVMNECSKYTNLNEAAKCDIPSSSHLLKEQSTDAEDAVATHKTHQSPPSLSDLDSSGPNKISLPSDIQEDSLGRQNLQEKSNRGAIRPPLLLRGRFHKLKPNLRQAIGRKEAIEKNETTVAIVGTEKSEIPISSRASSIILPLQGDDEALEDRLLGCEKLIQEDCQIPSTSRIISDQCVREKSTFQKDTLCTIKPTQLVRGRFQRARPNLGKMRNKKEEPVPENAGASLGRGPRKSETEVSSQGALNIPSVDEHSVQISLHHLEKKDQSECSEVQSQETSSEQKKPFFKMLQECEPLKDKEETYVCEDIEEKYLDIHGSDISAPQEISKIRNIKPIQLMRDHLQKPKPNLTRAAKNKETFSEGIIGMKNKIEKDAEGDVSLCGSKSGKIPILVDDIGKLLETASSSESLRERKCTETTETVSSRRRKSSGKSESLERLSESESQTRKDISEPLSAQEKAPEILKRKQPERSWKERKNTCKSKTTPSTSECKSDHDEKRRCLRKVKSNVSRGKSSKPAPGKKFGSPKVNLVTLRASSQEEDEDDEDDFEPDYVECFSPEEVNKAPVFVPKGLRSPNPVPVQIEETMEELEIYENVTEESCIATTEYLCPELNIATEPVIKEDKVLPSSLVVMLPKEPENKTGINDGSTEAAMTLLAMRDPVFQLNTKQETQEFPNQDELDIADSSSSKEPNEEQSIIHSDLPFSALSKPEVVSSHHTNKAEPKDPSTSGLEECSQEVTRACSGLSSTRENETSKLTRHRFPKPNFSKMVCLKRNALQTSLCSVLDVAQSNEIQNEEQTSKVTEEQKIEVEQNLQLEELSKSTSVDEHDLHPSIVRQAMQENNTERQDLAGETREGRLELIQKASPELESCPPELPREPNKDNVQFPESISRPAEYQLSTVDVAETEASKHGGISAITEITSVSHSIVECPEAEEEQTFILTLVEISADSASCSGHSPPLQHSSEELLLTPVLFTPDNTEPVELTRENSIRPTTATVEEIAASVDNHTKTEKSQISSEKHFADPISTSWNIGKKDAVTLEGSDNHPDKKDTSPAGESLKSSKQETSLKLRCIPTKAVEKSSEKFAMSKKKNSSTSNLVHDTSEIQVNCEQFQSSLNLEVVQLNKAASSEVQETRMLHSGKAKINEERRRFAKIWKSKQLEQVGGAAVLPKMPLSRPHQKSLGFLPLICKNNKTGEEETDNTDEEETEKGSKQSLQKPLTLIPQSTSLSPRDEKEDTPFQQEQFASTSLPRNSSLLTTNSSPAKCEDVISSTVQFHSDLSKNEGSSKEQEKDEEPTKISEYFFSDIFMEVDDSE